MSESKTLCACVCSCVRSCVCVCVCAFVCVYSRNAGTRLLYTHIRILADTPLLFGEGLRAPKVPASPSPASVVAGTRVQAYRHAREGWRATKSRAAPRRPVRCTDRNDVFTFRVLGVCDAQHHFFYIKLSSKSLDNS